MEVEGDYGGGPIKLDMVRVRLAKEVKVKDREIQELTQQKVIIECCGNLIFNTPNFSQRRDLKLRQT